MTFTETPLFVPFTTPVTGDQPVAEFSVEAEAAFDIDFSELGAHHCYKVVLENVYINSDSAVLNLYLRFYNSSGTLITSGYYYGITEVRAGGNQYTTYSQADTKIKLNSTYGIRHTIYSPSLRSYVIHLIDLNVADNSIPKVYVSSNCDHNDEHGTVDTVAGTTGSNAADVYSKINISVSDPAYAISCSVKVYDLGD